MYNRDNQGGALSRRPQQGISRPRGNDWLWQRDPWQEMQEMQQRVDHLFSRVFGQDWPAFSAPMGQMMNQMGDMGIAEPDIDFSENETEYTIQAALPGISPNDINVQATEDTIRLTAQSRSPSQAQNNTGTSELRNDSGQTGTQQTQGQTGTQQAQGQTTQHRQGQFSRINRFEFAYSLPEEIKPNEVHANFRNGVLELHLPKARPSAERNRAVTIPIQGADNTSRIAGASPGQQGMPSMPDMNRANAAGEHQAGGRSGDGSSGNQNAGQSSQSQTNTSGATAKSK